MSDKRRYYYSAKSSGPRLIDTSSKPRQRTLEMVIALDMPALADKIAQLSQRPPTVQRIPSSMIEWRRDGESFGFKVQMIDAAKLMDPAIRGTPDEPLLFPDHKIMYILEKGARGVNPPTPHGGKPPGSLTNTGARGATSSGVWGGAPLGAGGEAPSGARGFTPLTMIIASGESKLFAEVRALMEQLHPGRVDEFVRMGPLHTGDISWTRDNEQVGLIIERKDKSDFLATLRDPRKLQLQVSLDTAPDADKIMYLIEGDVLAVQSGIDDKARIGAMVYPIMRHGIRVASVPDTAASAALLVNLHRQMEWCDEDKFRAHRMHFGNALNAGPKKADYTGAGGVDELVRILSVVDGVSDPIAVQLSALFGSSFATFMNEMLTVDDPVARIADIVVDGRARRLGPELAKRVVAKFGVDQLRAQFSPASSVDDARKKRRIACDDDDDDSSVKNV